MSEAVPGLQIISELVESCRNHDFTDIVVLHEHRGEPDGMVVCHLPYGPTAYFGLYNAVRPLSNSAIGLSNPLISPLADSASKHFMHIQYYSE